MIIEVIEINMSVMLVLFKRNNSLGIIHLKTEATTAIYINKHICI